MNYCIIIEKLHCILIQTQQNLECCISLRFVPTFQRRQYEWVTLKHISTNENICINHQLPCVAKIHRLFSHSAQRTFGAIQPSTMNMNVVSTSNEYVHKIWRSIE